MGRTDSSLTAVAVRVLEAGADCDGAGCDGADCGGAEVDWRLHSIMPEFVAFVPAIRLAVGKTLEFERRGFGCLARAQAIERLTAVGRYLAAERVLVVGSSHWPEASAVH